MLEISAICRVFIREIISNFHAETSITNIKKLYRKYILSFKIYFEWLVKDIRQKIEKPLRNYFFVAVFRLALK